MKQFFMPVIKQNDGSHVGVLRIIQFEDGVSRADYFKGFTATTTDFGDTAPVVTGTYSGIKSPMKLANMMLDEFPENKING